MCITYTKLDNKLEYKLITNFLKPETNATQRKTLQTAITNPNILTVLPQKL